MREHKPQHGDRSGSDGGGEEAGVRQDPRVMVRMQRTRLMREFNRLTDNACADERGGVDREKLRQWQAAHPPLDPDGKLGRTTLSVARQEHEKRKSGGGAAEEKADGKQTPHHDSGGKGKPDSEKAGGQAAQPSSAVEQDENVDEAARKLPEPGQDEEAGEPAKGEEGDKGADDPVHALGKEISKHGLTPELQEQMERLSPRAIDRLVEYLQTHGAPGLKKIIAGAKTLKEEKGEKKELVPHGEGKAFEKKKKEHYKPDAHGKLENDTKGPPQAEFTHDRVKGVKGGSTLTGEDAHLHQQDHERREKDHAADEKKARGPVLGKAADVAAKAHSQLAHGETKEKKASVHDEKQEFGDGDHWGGDVHDRALDARAKASGDVEASWEKGVTVEGNANASATLVAGGAKVHTPPLPFTIAGEQFIASFNFFVDAGVLAEANGKIAVNLHPKGDAGIEAGISGFAGAKVSASASGTLDWVKKSPESYAHNVASSGGAEALLSRFLPPSVAKQVPHHALAPMVERLFPMLLGQEGDALVLAATMKGEASAGIGAAAGLEASFKGGVIHCHGKAGITFGAGLGGAFDLQLGLRDGMGLLALLMMKGSNGLLDKLQPSMQLSAFFVQHRAEIVDAIVRFCKEASKDKQNNFWTRHILQALGVGIAAMGADEI